MHVLPTKVPGCVLNNHLGCQDHGLHTSRNSVLLHWAYIAEIKVSCHQNDDAEATSRMTFIGDPGD